VREAGTSVRPVRSKTSGVENVWLRKGASRKDHFAKETVDRSEMGFESI